MNVKLVKTNVTFIQQRKAQNINLDVYFPLINGIIYSPIKWIIKSGIMSNDYLQNISPNKKDDRDEKTKLLEEITEPCEDGITFKIIKEKIYFNDFESKGLGIVGFISKLTGSNSNRFAKLYIKTEINEFQGLFLGRLFQDPKDISNDNKEYLRGIGLKNIRTISFDEFVFEEDEYARNLNNYYYDNIKTCSTNEIEIANNKNGQSKNLTYEELKQKTISEINEIKSYNIESTGMIMNAFKKALDIRFKVDCQTRTCLICGIKHPNMLVASHIKARSESDRVEEKIDPNNGFWLCAQHDRAFDRRLITFDSHGKIIVSEKLKDEHILDENYILPFEIFNESKEYLKYHKDRFNEKFGIR